jgi:hypothetical protein
MVAMNAFWILYLGLTLLAIAVILRFGPLLWRRVAPRIALFIGRAYQERLTRQLKKKFPTLAERLNDFDFAGDKREAFEAADRRLPPHEALKMQTEFNKIREQFVSRHPEVLALIGGATDPKTQVKAIDQVMALPEEKRQAIEADLLRAWDQLRSKYPLLMGALEGVFKKRPPQTEAK